MNNSAIFDSVLAGIAASNGAWLKSAIASDYNPEFSAAVAIATQVDAVIPTILTGVTISQRDLMANIAKAVMGGRSPRDTTPAQYSSIAQGMAALFTEFSGGLLDPDTGIPTVVTTIPNDSLSPTDGISTVIAGDVANETDLATWLPPNQIARRAVIDRKIVEVTATGTINLLIDPIADVWRRIWPQSNYGLKGCMRSRLVGSGSTGVTLVSGNCYFTYVGTTNSPIIAKYIQWYQSTLASGVISATEIGIFTAPSFPIFTGLGFAKLVATTAIDAITSTGPKKNTNPFNTVIAPYLNVFLGIRIVADVPGGIWGLSRDNELGNYQLVAGGAGFTTAGPWAGTIVSTSSPTTQYGIDLSLTYTE
jgi:hypothetical protein